MTATSVSLSVTYVYAKMSAPVMTEAMNRKAHRMSFRFLIRIGSDLLVRARRATHYEPTSEQKKNYAPVDTARSLPRRTHQRDATQLSPTPASPQAGWIAGMRYRSDPTNTM